MIKKGERLSIETEFKKGQPKHPNWYHLEGKEHPMWVEIEPELLWALYWGNQCNQEEIANIFGCSKPTIVTKMQLYDIPTRNNKGMELIESELLWALYWGNGYSQQEIADLFNYSRSYIKNKMEEYNIPKRYSGWQLKGENNPACGKHHSEETKKKISESKKGQVSYWKGKKRPGMSGKNHHNWKGGITEENILIRNSIEYNTWRNLIYKRDNWTCQRCNVHCDKYDIVAHHIKSFNDYPELRFDVDNGITLCRSCHAYVHKIK
jgi:DNA-binding CsgD family transcriptional regulator